MMISGALSRAAVFNVNFTAEDAAVIALAAVVAALVFAAVLMVRGKTEKRKGQRRYKRFKADITRCEKLFEKQLRERNYDAAAVEARRALEYMLAGLSGAGKQGGQSGVSNFQKIDMLRRSGRISARTHANFHMIRKYTNPGAHAGAGVSRENIKKVAELLDAELTVYFRR